MYACIILHIRVRTVHSSMMQHVQPWEYRLSCSTLNRLSSPLFFRSLGHCKSPGFVKIQADTQKTAIFNGENHDHQHVGITQPHFQTHPNLWCTFLFTPTQVGKGCLSPPNNCLINFDPPIPWLVPHDQKTRLVSCIEWTWRKRR